MKLNMTSLFIIIREPENARQVVDGIAAAVCPYLGTLGEQATIAATEHLRELRGGEETSTVTLLRVTLAGTARLEFSTLIAKLGKFLKQTAKDAEIDARFELFHLEAIVEQTSSHS